VLFRDGAKSETQFAAALDDSHPKTVVSLVDEKEQNDPTKPVFAAEPKLCEVRGIQLKHIEVKLGGWPDSDNIRQFLEIVNDPHNQPVLVHCAQGVRRTGFFVAAYQESVLGYDKEKAKSAIITFGHPKGVIDDIKRFIDNYDPASRSVPVLSTPKETTSSEADAR
jgi:protein tyrosine/serine phosphatase